MLLQPDNDCTYLLLARHGATANNDLRPPRLQGSGSDPPLSEQGQRQAAQLARLLEPQPLAAVFASPMVRAQQTAAAVAGPRSLEVATVEALIECDVGAWEGRTWRDIEREEPEAHRAFMTDPGTHGYRGGENLAHVEERILPAFAGLLESHPGGVILAVAHNVVNRVYLGHLLGVPLARRRGIPQENCGLNIIRHRGGETKLLSINSVFHLECL